MSTAFPAPSLEFSRPLMNAAGNLGFAPDARGPIAIEEFGAFVTNPISTRARRAANPPKVMAYPGGVLLHTGYPNPGMSGAIKQYAAAWARSPIPLIVHLLSDKPEDLRKAVLRLEELENVTSIELGFEAESPPALVRDLVQAAAGELPLIAQVAPGRTELAESAWEAGAAAVSLGPPRGALAGPDGKLVSGRLYGPALFPQALEMVRQLSRAGMAVIGAGGVENASQVEAMLAAGAIAVQMDVALWKGYAGR